MIAVVVAVVVAIAARAVMLPTMVATFVNPMILDALGFGRQDQMYGSLNSFFEKTIALLVVLFLILILLCPVSRRVLRIQLQPLAKVIGIGLVGAVVLNVVVVLWQRVVGDSGGSQLQAFGAGEGELSHVVLVLAIVAIAPPCSKNFPSERCSTCRCVRP